MSITLLAARDALAGQLAANTALGLRVSDTVPTTIVTPAAIVAPNPSHLADYNVAMGSDITQWTIRVVLVVATAVDRAAQDLMDQYISATGPLSVIAAIRADISLGGQVEWCVVDSAERYGTMTYGGVDYLGCELICEVSG